MCLSADWSRGGDCALAAVCAEGLTARAVQGEAMVALGARLHLKQHTASAESCLAHFRVHVYKIFCKAEKGMTFQLTPADCLACCVDFGEICGILYQSVNKVLPMGHQLLILIVRLQIALVCRDNRC